VGPIRGNPGRSPDYSLSRGVIRAPSPIVRRAARRRPGATACAISPASTTSSTPTGSWPAARPTKAEDRRARPAPRRAWRSGNPGRSPDYSAQ
jgi:hypothetical protein